MKQEYIVQWMTPSDYHRYMCGSNEYNYAEEIIIAENAQEAIEKCRKQYPQAIVNEHPQLKTEKEKKKNKEKKK